MSSEIILPENYTRKSITDKGTCPGEFNSNMLIVNGLIDWSREVGLSGQVENTQPIDFFVAHDTQEFHDAGFSHT